MTAPDQRMFAASRGTKLRDADPRAFHQCITRSAVLIGQNCPAPEAVVLMHSALSEQLPWATMEDIELAVRMNVARALPEHVKPFGEFSTAYVCEVLALYYPVRGKAVDKYQRMEEREERAALPAHELTDAEWDDLIRRDLAFYRAGKSFWAFSASRMVRWLYETGKINDDDYTADEWRRMKQKARAMAMDKLKVGPKAVERMEGNQRERFDQECLIELRAVLYGKYLESLKLATP